MVPFSDPCQHNFRLFAYFSVAIISFMTILFFFFVLQHIAIEEETEISKAKQDTVLENQNILKNITEDLQTHEFAEMKELQERTEISSNNSEKLDQVIELLLKSSR